MASKSISLIIISAVYCLLTGLAMARTIVVNNQAAGAGNTNPGSESQPLLTIQAGANLAQPGDTILVREGIYREEVKPPRGGEEGNPIVYYAARGEDVSIRGSERITGWVSEGAGVWSVEIDTSFFNGYNPYAIKILGAWLQGRLMQARLGDVYLNGEGHFQVEDPGGLTTQGTWHTDTSLGYTGRDVWPDNRKYSSGKVKISANFGSANPNTEMTEINVRKTCFFPDIPFLKYIVLDGFDIRHAATQWSDIYYTEYGAVGPRYGYKWVIQNNTIAYSRNNGISLGVTDEIHFPRGNEGGLLEGGSNIPSMDIMGSHVIRNNKIYRNGQCGIYGCYGGVGVLIEGNTIYETNYRTEWTGQNQADIKILFPIDAIIRHNRIYGIPGENHNTRGIWLDWGSQNARVTGNVIYDHTTGNTNQGLKTEVNFGPLVVDNNIFVRADMYEEGNGTLFAHNLFIDCDLTYKYAPDRIVPYFEPHSSVRAGTAGTTVDHQRFYNNIIIGGNGWRGGYSNVYQLNGAALDDVDVNYNVYLDGAGSFDSLDPESLVDAMNPQDNFSITEKALGLVFNLPAAALNMNAPVLTSEWMGKVDLTEMFMEQPDGTPYDLTTDFYGRPIVDGSVKPGPFQDINEGANTYALWPKAGHLQGGCMDRAYAEYDPAAAVHIPGACITDVVQKEPHSPTHNIRYYKNQLLISAQGPDSYTINIYDLKGIPTFRTGIQGGREVAVDVNLAVGIYQVVWESMAGRFITRIVVI